jgi:short-subunit dehydrogenase
MKRALVVGASVGLGRHIATGLAKANWEVCGVGRRDVRVDDLGYEYIRADLASWSDVDKLKQRLASDAHDLVVYNAAMYAESSPGQETTGELETLFRVNAIAPYVMLYDYLSTAKEELRTCIVVNSDAIYHASGQSGVYAATKAALRVFTTALAQAAKSRSAAAATLLLGPLADERKLDEFKKIAERRNLEATDVARIFLERSNPSFVIDALLEFEHVLESIRYIVSLGRAANGMMCKLDGGSSGSLV